MNKRQFRLLIHLLAVRKIHFAWKHNADGTYNVQFDLRYAPELQRAAGA